MLHNVKSNYKSLDMLQKIIVVNAIIYLFVNIGDVVLRLFNFPDGTVSGFLTDWLAVPSSLKSLLYRPVKRRPIKNSHNILNRI